MCTSLLELDTEHVLDVLLQWYIVYMLSQVDSIELIIALYFVFC